MTQHFDRRQDRVAPRSLPLGSIFSKLTSDIGGLLTDASPTPTPPTPKSPPKPAETTTGNAPPPPKPTTEMTTVAFTTVWRTSLVTVHYTTNVVNTPTPTATLGDPQSSATSGSDTPSSPVSSSLVGTSLIPVPITTTKHHTKAPVISSTGSSSLTSALSFPTHRPAASASATSAAGAAAGPAQSTSDDSRKHAIIGGLSGSIAGLLIIGILIFLFLRRRRNREDDISSTSEKGIRPAIAQKWSAFTARDLTGNPAAPRSQGTSTPDFDGGLIRVSLDQWPRPYAHGEGYRESMGPRRLQVMNPSPSRPATPLARGSSESVTGFFSRQKTALAGAIAGTTRARGNSTGESPNRALNVPTIAVDPALSTECVALNAPTPSFRSYSSVTSLPVVEQRPPEDPFLTPPDERAEDEAAALEAARSRRPGITPLQNAAGAASRTLSHIGSALNPFKSKSYLAPPSSVSSVSRNSVSTFSSGGDPFQLDRASDVEVAGGHAERAERGTWTVYEGT